MNVMHLLLAGPCETKERKEEQPEHVEHSKQGCEQCHTPCHWVLRKSLRQNFVLGKETRKGRNSGNSKNSDHECQIGDRQIFLQSTHPSDILFALQRMDYTAGAQEQQCLEERMRHHVENAARVSTEAKGHEHQPKLTYG